VRLTLPSCIVREWAADDLAPLVRHANDREIWIHLRDRFPHPYLEEHGRSFLDRITRETPAHVWAIEVAGEAAGAIGLELSSDVERVSAEIGYWLGRACWGRGIMTEAVRAVTADAFRHFELTRIFALPFADNPGSIRVLEKAGYALEGRLPQSAIKDGRLRDQLMYGAYRKLR
jgi:RimJ/RimL family protein N-acetyltransferase